MFYKFLFPQKTSDVNSSLLLLAARIILGTLFMTHGLQKLANFAELSQVFPDPLGVGSTVSLVLAIFGEVACSIAFVFGFLYRLAMIPMIFTMIIAFFVVHGNDPFAVRELSFLYLVIYSLMYIAGPGRYAIDAWIGKKNSEKV